MRYTVDVTPADTGARVTLRRRLPEGGLTDVVGVLEQWSGGVLRVRDRAGTPHDVDERTVVALKRVPPPPARR